MRTKQHAFIRHLPHFRQTEKLESRPIREDRPGHDMKLVEAAQWANQFVARMEIEMIGI